MLSLARVSAVWGLLSLTFQSTEAVLPAFQSGPNSGSVYAAGIVNDVDSGLIYVTGITYDANFDPSDSSTAAASASTECSCFISEFTDDSWGSTLASDKALVYGSPTVVEACRNIAILSDQQLVVVGNSDAGGLYASGTSKVQVGFSMTIGRDDLDVVSGKALETESAVPYPQAVVVDPTDSDVMYVASMVSKDQTDNTDSSEEFPNWTHEFKHGGFFELTVERYEYNVDKASSTFDGIVNGGSSSSSSPGFTTKWSHYFPVNASESDTSAAAAAKSVYVGGMIYKSGVGLIVAGSTASEGEGYGPAEGDDEDGFVTILDPSTGELASGRKNNERMGTAEFDIITSICDDPNDPDYFYVVGATKGSMDDTDSTSSYTIPDGSLQAFIRKVYVDDLFSEWTVQLGAYDGTSTTSATAYGCVVFDDTVYVAGTVRNGAGMVSKGTSVLESAGGDDIWAAQLATNVGEVYWMQQVGSSGDDHIALGGGITTDSEGNVIIFGDTNGPFYRDREVSDVTDVFGITLSYETGSFETTSQGRTAAPIADDLLDGETEGEDDFYEYDQTEAVIPSWASFHQSGPNDGAIYASGIAVNEDTNEVIVAGISYTQSDGDVAAQPDCLVARIELDGMKTRKYNIMGSADILEACRSVALSDDGTTIAVVGNSDAGGLFSKSGAVQTGFGFTMSSETLSDPVGASLFSAMIPYPEAVIFDGSDIYVASTTSNDVTENANSNKGQFPNWTYLNQYGSGFVMTIEKFSSDWTSKWSKTYATTEEADGNVFTVYVGGIVMKNGEYLVAAGSTRAQGEAYGDGIGDDEDGFVTLLNPSTGELLDTPSESTVRIGSTEDDVITGICDVPDDDETVILVGATKGDIGGIQGADLSPPSDSLSWFAMKFNVETFQREWIIQGGALKESDTSSATSTYALGCHVVDEDTVYIAGTVENGAGMIFGADIQSSGGGDDVWVAELDLSDGSVNWLTQFGSAGDEHLARQGGVTIDADGNAVVYGDTTGPLYRDRSIGDNADIFLAILDWEDGSFVQKGTSAPVAGDPTPAPTRFPTSAPTKPTVVSGGTTDTGDAIEDDIVAIQLGPDLGPTYAGGMEYEKSTNSLYLTGSTYGAFSGPALHASTESSCFFARLDLPDLEIIQRSTYGVSTAPDSCNAIVSNDYDGKQNAIMIGTTGVGGLMTELTTVISSQYGIAIDLSLETNFEYVGGAIIGDGQVTYPVSVVANGEQFFTASMVSASKEVEADLNKVERKEYPNLTTGGVKFLAAKYALVVESFTMASGSSNPFSQGASITYKSNWRASLDVSKAEKSAVSGMVQVDDDIIVVGTISANDKTDGFVSMVSMEDGSADTTYLDSISGGNEWIMGACSEKDEGSYFYIVGATSGSLDDSVDRSSSDSTVHAFVAKMAKKDLSLEWVKQFGVVHASGSTSKAAAAAYGCDVLGSDKILYVGGTVENGAVMSDADVGSASGGRDDIFVAQISTIDGSLKWFKQTGSNGDDRIARGGGIQVDGSGNAVVYGDTTGSFFRDRSNDDDHLLSDPFVMVFDKHYGTHQSPFDTGLLSGASKSSASGMTPSEFFASLSKKGNAGKVIGVIVLVLVILGCSVFMFKRRSRSGRATKNMMDASTPYEDDHGGKSFGVFKDDPHSPPRDGMGYRDSNGGSDGVIGNFHKTYSDLPQKGKEII